MGSAARAELFSCECMDCDGLVKCQARNLLPTHVKPMHYSLHTTPNLEAFTFTGTVRITLVCSYPTSKLVLHAHELNISRASLAIKGKEKSLDVAPENIVFNETDQTVSLTLSETFQNGTLSNERNPRNTNRRCLTVLVIVRKDTELRDVGDQICGMRGFVS